MNYGNLWELVVSGKSKNEHFAENFWGIHIRWRAFRPSDEGLAGSSTEIGIVKCSNHKWQMTDLSEIEFGKNQLKNIFARDFLTFNYTIREWIGFFSVTTNYFVNLPRWLFITYNYNAVLEN